MLKSQFKKIIIVFLILAVIWFTASAMLSDKSSSAHKADTDGQSLDSSPSTLVSAVQPVELASQSQFSESENRTQSQKLNNRVNNGNSDLLRRFTEANQQAERSNKQAAITAYRSLIEDYPDSLEPYLNLAVIYAEQQQLDQARLTLNAGLNAKADSAALYKALQQVHNALAGQAYQRALNSTQPQNTTLALQKSTSLRTQVNPAADKKYEQRLTALQLQHQREVGAYQDKINVFETQLETLQNELNSMSLVANNARDQEQRRIELAEAQFADQQAELLSLKQQQSVVSEQLLKEQAAREQLEKQKIAALEQASQQQLLLARQHAQQQEEQAARDAQLLAQQVAKQKQQEQAQSDKRQSDQVMIDLVRAWAKAWSEQNVKSYVSFYTDDYVPAGKNLTHRQWLAQRQVRLTNKSFIKVDVSEYHVDDLGERVSVSFTQHYRSDTIDDRIRKRLTFVKNGDDWSKAKINSERVL